MGEMRRPVDAPHQLVGQRRIERRKLVTGARSLVPDQEIPQRDFARRSGHPSTAAALFFSRSRNST